MSILGDCSCLWEGETQVLLSGIHVLKQEIPKLRAQAETMPSDLSKEWLKEMERWEKQVAEIEGRVRQLPICNPSTLKPK